MVNCKLLTAMCTVITLLSCALSLYLISTVNPPPLPDPSTNPPVMITYVFSTRLTLIR